jgi:gamma-glutamyltranspeptidase/glutathione hydrolase
MTVALAPRRAGPVLIAAALFLAPAPTARAASPPAVRANHGMVASADSRASEIGCEILRRGGSAVDASIAAAFALAVTYPEAGNLGGGGFLLLRRADGSAFALDFRETAPRAAGPGLYLDEHGRAVPSRSLRGGLSVAVPGSVAGLWEAHRRWGRRPWRDLVEPAARLARRGSPLSRRESSELAERAADLAQDLAARAIFFRDGRALREGESLVQRDLAATLDRIASRGTRGFYEGPVAEAIVRAVREAGGVLERSDLAEYRPLVREPVVGSYRGRRILAFPPPSSGGIALLQILGMLERFDLSESGPGSSRTIHRMVEAARRAYADRARWLGDPAFSTVPVARLLSPAHLAALGGTIREDRATPSSEVAAGGLAEREGADTTHLSAVDDEGNAVALTTTLNSSFGAAIVAPGTGVLLNNQMDDFALSPGVPNQYGLTGGTANAVAGGKRPLSSMSPTIVERPDGCARPLLVLGSPGGATIITTVAQVVVNVVDHGMELQEAVDFPRVHHQWLPDRIDVEPRALPSDVARALESLGHTVHVRAPIGYVPAVGTASDGTWLGAIDPRRGGLAAGY